jgi:hypothetical protein
LLGRDTWPLLPLLRNRGRDARYFLWTRLQTEDLSTANQWLKEVPPGAAVVDTGFAGSVLDAISKYDNTASGYLLSSSGSYPQLLIDHPEAVSNIESLPKLVGRSTTYTKHGGAVTKQVNRDEADDDAVDALDHANNIRRWHVGHNNQQLLTELGLPAWDVWRYTEYVGLTPKERLLINSDAELQKHYANVSQLRNASNISH